MLQFQSFCSFAATKPSVEVILQDMNGEIQKLGEIV